MSTRGVSRPQILARAQLALTQRDLDLLEVLTQRVRCLSLLQVACEWWKDGLAAEASARRRLDRLVDAGLLRAEKVLARKPLCPQGPVVRWHAGLSEPEFGPIAQFLKTRFTTEPRSTMVVVGTDRAARLTGGRAGRIPRRSEATHDLSLASVFLWMRRTSPVRARTWIYETKLMTGRPVPGTKLPDAMVTETDGTPTVIELGGEYPKAKLLAFQLRPARS
jgi:hypothetical protein